MMQPTGFEGMSDEEFMALMRQGKFDPVNAQSGQPLPPEQARGYQNLGAAGGIDPNAPPGSARMPRAQVPGGQPSEYDFYMDEQGRVHQQPPLSDMRRALMGGIRSWGRGTPILGALADEANAATAALVAPVAEPLARHAPKAVQDILGYDPRLEISDAEGGFMGRYNAAKNIQQFTDQSFAEEHPRLNAGLELGGGLTGGVAGLKALSPLTTVAIAKEASLPLRMAAGAGDAAMVGGATGYGLGNGAWNDESRIRSAGAGALFGGMVGGAMPAAGALASKGWQATGGRLVDAVLPPVRVQSPSSISAADRVVEALRGDPAPVPPGATGAAERVAQSLRGDTAGISGAGPLSGAQRTALEARVSRVAPDLPDVTVRASDAGEAYRRIARAIQRQNMTPDEALAATQGLGPMGVLADSGEGARDLLRASINRPGRGATIARQNLDPRQQGLFNPETGMYDIRPSSLRLVDEAASGMGLKGREFYQEMDNLLTARKAAADPAYAKMRSHPPAATSELAAFDSDLLRDAYKKAVDISKREFVKVPGGDGEAIMPLPDEMPSHLDWRTLDLMKQGMDDIVYGAKTPTSGVGKNELGVTKDFLQRFVRRLDELNPDYKGARDAFAGPTAMMDALEAGRTALREDAPVLSRSLGELSESERTMYRLGALQELQKKLGNANVTFDAANQAGFLKPNQLQRFRELFPDAQSFTNFYRAMEREKQMFGTNSAAFGNSTSTRQALHAMEPNDPQAEGAAMLAQSVVGGGASPMAVIPALRRLGMESPISESAAETIASLLTTNDPVLQRSLVQQLHGAAVANAAQDTIRRMGAAGAGQAGATAARPNQ